MWAMRAPPCTTGCSPVVRVANSFCGLKIPTWSVRGVRFETQLMQDLHWLGLDWDEGPSEKVALSRAPSAPTVNPNAWKSTRNILNACSQRKRHIAVIAQGRNWKPSVKGSRGALPQVYSGQCRKLTPRHPPEPGRGKPFAVRLKIDDRPCASTTSSAAPSSSLLKPSSDPVIVRSAAECPPASPFTTTWSP